jgi:hypothetical protein
MQPTQTTLSQIKAEAASRGNVVFIDDSLLESAKRLEFIVDAVAHKGLTYKEASALWADGIDTLHTSVETITTSERGL